MKKVIVLISVASLVFLASSCCCEEELCRGHQEEPSWKAMAPLNHLQGVEYLNGQGEGGWIDTLDGQVALPIDPNSKEMIYHFLIDSISYKVNLNYSVEVTECEKEFYYLLNFSNVSYDTSKVKLYYQDYTLPIGMDSLTIDSTINAWIDQGNLKLLGLRESRFQFNDYQGIYTPPVYIVPQ